MYVWVQYEFVSAVRSEVPNSCADPASRNAVLTPLGRSCGELSPCVTIALIEYRFIVISPFFSRDFCSSCFLWQNADGGWPEESESDQWGGYLADICCWALWMDIWLKLTDDEW